MLKKRRETYKYRSYCAIEYCAKGDLFFFLQHLGKFPETMARAYAHQILDGLEAMHGAGVFHGDVKLDNLLISDGYVLKLSDFGFTGNAS
jgi:serine/threonine protein kinase